MISVLIADFESCSFILSYILKYLYMWLVLEMSTKVLNSPQ